MKQWLADRLAITERAATPGACSSCGTPVLGGLDADLCAIAVIVDTQPLTAAGELRAHLAGQQTYDHHRGELHHRHRWAITAHPGSRPRHDVLATHTCPA